MSIVVNKLLPKRLIAFDFDHTIVEKNTDIVVRDLISSDKIPAETISLYKSTGWTKYMQEIFKLLYKNGIRKSDILRAVTDIPEVKGMKKCISDLHAKNFDVIIVSDSNSEFITMWNEKYDLGQYFTTIITNPASFDKDELLNIEPFHHQTDCAISSTNLCKGTALCEFIKMQETKQGCAYKNVLFVGDGYHDICGMLRLNANGFACPRIGYAAERDIYKAEDKINAKLRASIINWNDGCDLMQQIVKALDLTK